MELRPAHITELMRAVLQKSPHGYRREQTGENKDREIRQRQSPHPPPLSSISISVPVSVSLRGLTYEESTENHNLLPVNQKSAGALGGCAARSRLCRSAAAEQPAPAARGRYYCSHPGRDQHHPQRCGAAAASDFSGRLSRRSRRRARNHPL